jgi:hypothetical protein
LASGIFALVLHLYTHSALVNVTPLHRPSSPFPHLAYIV